MTLSLYNFQLHHNYTCSLVKSMEKTVTGLYIVNYLKIIWAQSHTSWWNRHVAIPQGELGVITYLIISVNWV